MAGRDFVHDAAPFAGSGRQMSEVKPLLSEGEERFERFRRRFGLVAAPVICGVVWWLPIPGLSVEAHRLLAVLGLVVALWISEAIPMPVTALLGPALCVVAGVGGARDVLQSFANPVIFLFLGSFMLAEAMLHHGLNRRIAFRVLGMRAVGESSLGLLCAFGGIAAVLSMWASNTATTAMMMPIGVSILTVIARRESERAGREVKFTELPFGTGLMLLAAFGASVGGMATPVGTPPNLIGRQLIEERLGVGIPFVQWMTFGVPLAAGMVVFLVLYFWKVCPAGEGMLEGGAEWIMRQRAELGPWSRGEINVVIAFGLTNASRWNMTIRSISPRVCSAWETTCFARRCRGRSGTSGTGSWCSSMRTSRPIAPIW
jgi:sodium-dependent dicarboxylate transporter 2/3/5